VPIGVAAGFVVGCALMVPTSLLVPTALVILGPEVGLQAAFGGMMTAALVGWLAGRLGWRQGIRRVAGPHVERIARRLGARRDVRTLASLRLFPNAPFTVVSVVCGALGVRLDRFLLATLVGILPSLVVSALLVYALTG